MRRLLVLGFILLIIFACRQPVTKKIDITAQQVIGIGETIPLKVTLVSPIGSVEGEQETFKVLVGFNQSMTPLQAVPREETEGPLLIEPVIKGKYRWLGTRALAFIPADTLSPATEFRVILKKNKIQSLTGMRLERDTVWTFESVRPGLLASQPYHYSEMIDTKTNIYLNFNMVMMPNRVKDKIKMFTGYAEAAAERERIKPKKSHLRNEQPIRFRVRQLQDKEKKDWPLKDWDNKKTLVLVPNRPLPIQSNIEVHLYPGLLAKVGDLGLAKEEVINFRTYNWFTLSDYSNNIPGSHPLMLKFSNPVTMDELLKNIEFKPAIEIPEEYKKRTYSSMEVYLYFHFELNTKYKIKINRKLKDIFGNKLDKDYKFDLTIGDYLPYVDIPTGINIVESKSDLRIPATFVNANRVHIEKGLVNLEDAIPFLSQPNLFNFRQKFEQAGFFQVSRFWDVNTFKKYPNIRARLPIELDEILGQKKAGLVFIQLDDLGLNQNSTRYWKSFLEVSDLGITWKYSPENNLVWVTSLNSTEPVKNAKVQFRDEKNRVLAESFTNNSGFCELPGWAETKLREEKATYESGDEYELESYTERYEPNFWLTVAKDEDGVVYSNRWNFGINPWRFNVDYNWDIRSEEYLGYIFTEKGLYKSGETVHIKGILRKKRKGEWILPDLSKVNFIVRNALDEEIINDTLSINSYGAFFKDIALPNDAPTGIYSIRVLLPKKDYSFYHSFRVEAYRPAEFEVKASAERDTFIAGENFEGKISGQYLFGMPMSNAAISWNLRKDFQSVSYPMHKGYSFGSYEQRERGRDVLGSGSGKLNEQGEYPVTMKLASKDINTPSAITLEGTVTSPNQKSLFGRQNWLAFPANLLIGLKTKEYLYTTGDTVEIDLITIRPSGVKIGNRKVALSIVKQEWKSIKKARFGGRYEWVSERTEKAIKKLKATSRIDASRIDFISQDPGYYYIQAEAKDEKNRATTTRIYFYVTGRGYAGWQMRDDDIIELVADKESYQVGDTARILVKSPYDSANALVTVERELILRKFTKQLHGNADFVEVPIKSIDLPNVYVCVTLLRGRSEKLGWDEEKQADLGKPQFKIGYVNLRVDAKDKHLMVKTASDKSEYRPRDSVTVDYEIKDFNRNPVNNSEVSLFVVDLGVLNLIDFRTPNPFDYFYGSRPLSVKTIESRLNIIGERSYGEKGEERGGGGGMEGIAYREKFIATVYYKGDLKTDENGKGTVKFVLPDNLTKFRIMVVAQTKQSEFGSAESTFMVNLPFILTPSIPRFARVGDKFEAGIVLHNRTKKENRAEVDCKIDGLKLIGDNHQEIVLPAGSSKEALFSFTAEKTGTTTFAFNAQMGEEKDALKLKIPVKLPPFVEAVATFSSTPDSALEALIVPANIYENLGGLEVLLSSSVLAGMENGIEGLLDYPYGCLEQRISRILPLIVGEELINQFKLAPVIGKALRDTVQKVLDEVPEYQLSNGGFVYFKESEAEPCPYLSAYTMYVLKRAVAAGYKVDEPAVEKGKEFLKEVLRWNNVDWTYPYNEDARLTTMSFCLYSLSLWGEKEISYTSQLFEQREKLSIFGKTLLLKTGRILGMGSEFENELVRMITNKIKISPTTAHFEESENRGWTFPSPAKVTGFVIQTFAELDIPFPYQDQVIRWLVQERGKKTKPTTHENAFVFDAFQTYYKKFEKEEPNFVARVLLGQKEILKETFKGRTNEPPKRFTYSLDKIPHDTLLPIKIYKDGTGRLYYTLRMTYAYKENPIPFDEGFYVWKEILTLDGKEPKTFNRGEVYKVVLHIVVPETRLFAVVDDPLPAGFEPVQTFFATESREIQARYSEEETAEAENYWWGGFDHKEFYDDRVLLFAQELFPGEHTQVYYVKAGTSGEFLSPSAKAEEMYSPEVFGSTSQGFINVK
jgi:alpha-2-macroglobulin